MRRRLDGSTKYRQSAHKFAMLADTIFRVKKNLFGYSLHTFGSGLFESKGVAKKGGTRILFVSFISERTCFSNISVGRSSLEILDWSFEPE
jgi:hypothetical protein